jgi:hypothetical protein
LRGWLLTLLEQKQILPSLIQQHKSCHLLCSACMELLHHTIKCQRLRKYKNSNLVCTLIFLTLQRSHAFLTLLRLVSLATLSPTRLVGIFSLKPDTLRRREDCPELWKDLEDSKEDMEDISILFRRVRKRSVDHKMFHLPDQPDVFQCRPVLGPKLYGVYTDTTLPIRVSKFDSGQSE